MSINKAIITGNLTRDPELRRTQSGTAVLNFGVAVNDRRRNPQTGEWEDYANYIDCTMFGNRAESVANYISKGSKVAIEGKLHWSQWERDGQKRSKIEVVVDEIEFMSRNQNGSNGGYQQNGGGYNPQQQSAPQNAPQQPQGGYYGQAQGQYQQQPPTVDTASSVYDDDIPF